MSVYRFYKNQIESHISSTFWDERRCSFGNKNPCNTFYVIRRSDRKAGLFSIYTYVLGKVKLALEKGYIPVVDLENYKCSYTNNHYPGRENAWEYFFEQVNKCYNLDEVYKSENVILSDSVVPKNMPNTSMKFLKNHTAIAYWRDLANEYCKINSKVMSRVDDEYDLLFGKTKPSKILGVLLRGTDYVNLRPPNHPKQPTLSEAITEVRRLMSVYGCEYIYLTTEDEELLAGMVNEFGSILKFSNVPRYRHDIKGYLSEEKRNVKDDYIQKGYDYIVPIGVISKLTCFFAGRTSGSVAAVIMSSSLDKVTFWDDGVY